MGSAISPSVFLGSVIRSYLVLTKIRFTAGYATGLKNPKNTRTGITDPGCNGNVSGKYGSTTNEK